MKRYSVILLIALALSLLLTACGDTGCEHTDANGDLVCDACAEALPDPNLDGKIVYKIKVTDPDGNAAPNIIVELYDGEKKIAMKMTDAEGIVKCSEEHPIAAGSEPFKVKLVSPDGRALSYDEAAAVIADGAEEITVALYRTTLDLPTESLSIDSDTPVEAPVMSNGSYRVALKTGKNYFIFVAQERGEYLISTDFDENVNLGYHGGVFYVQQNDVSGTDDTAEVVKSDAGITFKIRSFNVGETIDSSSKYVISIESDKETSGTLIIKRVADLPLSAEEMPWQEAPMVGSPEKFELSPNGESVALTDFDITDPTLAWVYSEADGYYHLGDENGPILYMRLNSSSKYAASLAEICETNGYGVYIYDDNGDFVEKRSYSTLFTAYSEAADENTGVYPVTRDLYDFVVSYGAHNGWWERSAELNRFFGELAPRIIKENAWAFAVCYVA